MNKTYIAEILPDQILNVKDRVSREWGHTVRWSFDTL